MENQFSSPPTPGGCGRLPASNPPRGDLLSPGGLVNHYHTADPVSSHPDSTPDGGGGALVGLPLVPIVETTTAGRKRVDKVIEGQHFCPHCPRRFVRAISVGRHCDNFHRAWRCGHCPVLCADKPDWRIHMAQLHPQEAAASKELFLCDYCPRVLTSESNLASHFLSFHAETDCGACGERLVGLDRKHRGQCRGVTRQGGGDKRRAVGSIVGEKRRKRSDIEGVPRFGAAPQTIVTIPLSVPVTDPASGLNYGRKKYVLKEVSSTAIQEKTEIEIELVDEILVDEIRGNADRARPKEMMVLGGVTPWPDLGVSVVGQEVVIDDSV